MVMARAGDMLLLLAALVVAGASATAHDNPLSRETLEREMGGAMEEMGARLEEAVAEAAACREALTAAEGAAGPLHFVDADIS